MKFYWIKTSRFIKAIFPKYVWNMPAGSKTVYLTFDDGPTPEVTDFVLDVLRQYEVKATFFVIGKNVAHHPELFQRIINEGHRIGNHTDNHVNGWKTSFKEYIDEVNRCAEHISKHLDSNENIPLLFRPPYGKISGRQALHLISQGYKIIMWDVLTADFDLHVPKEKCLVNATVPVNDGSIIIFHDSIKAAENMRYALPKAIGILKEKGYNFEVFN